jgi:hypothetical protein
MNSRFHLHEFLISTSRIFHFNITNSRFQLNKFTISTSWINDFNFMNSSLKLALFWCTLNYCCFVVVFCTHATKFTYLLTSIKRGPYKNNMIMIYRCTHSKVAISEYHRTYHMPNSLIIFTMCCNLDRISVPRLATWAITHIEYSELNRKKYGRYVFLHTLLIYHV